MMHRAGKLEGGHKRDMRRTMAHDASSPWGLNEMRDSRQDLMLLLEHVDLDG